MRPLQHRNQDHGGAGLLTQDVRPQGSGQGKGEMINLAQSMLFLFFIVLLGGTFWLLASVKSITDEEREEMMRDEELWP